MTTILRLFLFLLLTPVFGIVAQAAGTVQDSFRVVDVGFRTQSIVLQTIEAENCNYDSSGALLQQRKSQDGESADEDRLSELNILRSTGSAWPLFSFLAEFFATNKGATALSTYRKTTAGETFQHYGYKQQAANFQGGLRPGGFATTADGLTGVKARSGLSLPHATPPNAVYTVTPQAGTVVRVNPITKAEFGQPGGLPEFQFPNGTGAGTVSGPRTLP